MDQTIVLCKNLAFVAASGQTLTLDWIGVDAGFQNGVLVFEAKTLETGTIGAELFGSTDGVITSSVVSTSLAAQGRIQASFNSGLLPLQRLVLSAVAAAARGVVSAYLLLKHE